MKPQFRRRFLAWLARGAVMTSLLTLAIALVPFYARLWLAPVALIVPLLLPQYTVSNVHMIDKDAQWLIMFDMVTRQTMAIDQGTIPAGTAINASTLAAHAIEIPLLLMTTLVLWPLQHQRQQLQRLFLSLPATGVLTLLDIPFMIAGAIATLTGANNFLSAWAQWLDGGGRFALAIAAAVLIRMMVARASSSHPAAAMQHQ